MLKGHNSGKKSVEHDYDKICASSGHGNNILKVSYPLKTVGGVAETRTSVDKMAKTDKGP